jgi:peptide/nickel transport system substrate-binding protein
LFFDRFRRSRKHSADHLTERQVLSVASSSGLPSWRQWKQLASIMDKQEKTLFLTFLFLIVLSAFVLVTGFILSHRTEIPTIGGEYTEGLIGTPQFINPLYASANDVDADLSQLVFSGLLKWDPSEGLINDLAESVEISEDGLSYTVKIRDNARFHNGEDVRARDVLFTINAIQNTDYHSPLAVSFYGITATQVDDKTITFTLTEPFAPFLHALTTGILPAGAWGTIAPRNAQLASLNLEPIGSGPYRFAKFSKDKNGNILSYTLERNADYYGTQPMIEQLHFKFYPDALSALDALENKNIEGISYIDIDQEELLTDSKQVTLSHPTIPREIVLFFNESTHPALANEEMRKAITLALNKEDILSHATNGNGQVIHGPILPNMIGFHNSIELFLQNIDEANNLLDELYEWEEGNDYRTNINEAELLVDEEEETTEEEETEPLNEEAVDEESAETEEAPMSDDSVNEQKTTTPLQLSLTTIESTQFIRAAELIRDQLAQVGILVEIQSIRSEEFYSTVITPRNYELLLTGVLLGDDPDPYPFWHSSQADTGLNLADYENEEVDTLLEKARTSTEETERAELYIEFQDLLVTDFPAVFLYQSTYTYALSTKIQGASITHITTPADRFATIEDWYIETKKVLK